MVATKAPGSNSTPGANSPSDRSDQMRKIKRLVERFAPAVPHPEHPLACAVSAHQEASDRGFFFAR